MAIGTITRGDTEVINITVFDAGGTARNVTTDTMKFTIKNSEKETTYLVQKTVGTGVPGTAVPAGSVVKLTQSGGTIGRVDVTLSPSDLTTLGTPGTLQADLEITDSSGRVSTTRFEIGFMLDIS